MAAKDILYWGLFAIGWLVFISGVLVSSDEHQKKALRYLISGSVLMISIFVTAQVSPEASLGRIVLICLALILLGVMLVANRKNKSWETSFFGFLAWMMIATASIVGRL